MSLFDLSILDVLPKVVADGSEGGVHLYAEVTPESYGGFIYRTFLFRKEKVQKEPCKSQLLFFGLVFFDSPLNCIWKWFVIKMSFFNDIIQPFKVKNFCKSSSAINAYEF